MPTTLEIARHFKFGFGNGRDAVETMRAIQDVAESLDDSRREVIAESWNALPRRATAQALLGLLLCARRDRDAFDAWRQSLPHDIFGSIDDWLVENSEVNTWLESRFK